MSNSTPAYETKDGMAATLAAPAMPAAPGLGYEVAEAFDGFMTAFESFKRANDERLKQIETRVGADVVTVEKVERINAALDEQKRMLDGLSLKSQRPRLAASRRASPYSSEHKSAFERYVRSGEAGALRGLEEKALQVGSGPDGGYLVPDEVETEINRRLAAISPIRGIASVRQVNGAVLKKPFSRTGPAVGWVGETETRLETQSPVLDEMSFPTMELYAMPAATQTLLDDAAVDVDQWIAEEVEIAFAEQEGRAFVLGDGVNKPRGFLDYPTAPVDTAVHGELGTVSSGVTGGFDPAGAGDALVDLVYALRAGYRQNARFVMSRRTQAEVRKLKDAEGNYLWRPANTPEERPSLMGFAVTEAEDMPDIGADTPSIAFGDFGRGYLVVDRTGVRVLRDPYSSKPFVLFYTTKRVGGGVQDFDAIKLLRFSA